MGVLRNLWYHMFMYVVRSLVVLLIGAVLVVVGGGSVFAEHDSLFLSEPVFSIKRDQYRVNDGDSASFTITSAKSGGATVNLLCTGGNNINDFIEMSDGWSEFILTEFLDTVAIRTQITISSFPYSFALKTRKGVQGMFSCSLLESAEKLKDDFRVDVNGISIVNPFLGGVPTAASAGVEVDCLGCGFSNYSVGQSHPDIQSTQALLNQTPCPVVRAGVGLRGQETGFFDVQTYQSIVCYNYLRSSVDPSFGVNTIFGAGTRPLTQSFIKNLTASRISVSDISDSSPEISVVQKSSGSGVIEYEFKVTNNMYQIKDYYLFYSFHPGDFVAYEGGSSEESNFLCSLDHLIKCDNFFGVHYSEPDVPSFVAARVHISVENPTTNGFEGVLGVLQAFKHKKNDISHPILNGALLLDTNGDVVPARIKQVVDEQQMASSSQPPKEQDSSASSFNEDTAPLPVPIKGTTEPALKRVFDKILDLFFGLFGG